MSRTRVKICGITRAEDRDVAVTAGADAVGFITDVPVETPREISSETATRLVRDVPPFVTSVLVTMPETVQEAVTLQQRVQADAIQVHGLSPEAVGDLSERVLADVIAAVDSTEADLGAYAEAADMLLVDSTTEEGAGGTGKTHDWNRTRAVVSAHETPVGLAGGLVPENVREAVETVEPFAVDTASGVERAGGIKDHDAVRAFVGNAHENTGFETADTDTTETGTADTRTADSESTETGGISE